VDLQGLGKAEEFKMRGRRVENFSAFFFALVIMSGVISTPITCQSGPTIFAARKVSNPAPFPKSRNKKKPLP